MVIVYAISSLVKNYIYVGQTINLHNRLLRHNNGYEKTTRPYRPYKLIYTENFTDRISARKKREIF